MSTDDQPHHTRCPDGEDSWCFFKKAEAKGEVPDSHEDKVHHKLAFDVAQEMLPVYRRMSDPNLLKRLAKGKTQNPNECLHSVLWSRCPKTIFVGRHRIQGAAASAVAAFNGGCSQLTHLMDSLAIEYNEVTNASVTETNPRRILQAEQSATEQNKKRRLSKKHDAQQQNATHLAAEGPTYAAGAF